MATPKYTNKLANTSVLIIGGTSGLGFGLAEALIEYRVSKLYISSSRQEKVDAAISRLQSAYPESATKITGLPCNLGDEATLESNIKALFSGIDSKLDHVVFTAGDPLAAKPLQAVDMPFMKQAGMVRFFAPFFVAKEAVAHLNAGPASSITLTTGSVSEKPVPNWTVVASYASAMHGMTRGLALDLKPVRVNLISPGGVDTELWVNWLGNKERAQAVMEGMKASVATGEIGRVEDVVESYLYVLKDRNVTGSVVRTDGGVFLM
jgi:NAD(P)-dependent dehydrogenase (short-subunit alcohol dehydrogenase family)